MKIEFIKLPGGMLSPADDYASEKMKKFKNEEIYEVDIKLYRNPQFHSKMFAFFHFCFDHWCAEHTELEFMDEDEQFKVFRQNLVAKAGYFTKNYNLKGELRIEAKSLSYGNMEQDEFEKCYNAVIQVALKFVFKDASPEVENKILSFF